MCYVLENEFCRLECIEDGGQIQHFIDKENDVELMYQGDQGWSGKNPTLFPLVGNTYSKEYAIDGKTYAMKNHGLIRYATCVGLMQDDCLTFTYDSNAETLAQYPFEFHYEIQYRLEKKTLKINYVIENTGSRDMPFSFGLHPAFRVPERAGEAFTDYTLTFEKQEPAKQLLFDETFVKPSKWVDTELDVWHLNYEDIDEYKTIIYKDFQSNYVTLAYKDQDRLRVHFKDFPYLAIWTHPKHSEFLCIEPWYGHADFDVNHTSFYQREGTQILAPNEKFMPSYQIEIC